MGLDYTTVTVIVSSLTLNIRRGGGSLVAPVDDNDTGGAMQVLVQQRIHHVLNPPPIARLQVPVTDEVDGALGIYAHRVHLVRIVDVDELGHYSRVFVEHGIAHLHH